MADLNQQEATAFFRSLGFHTYKCPDLHYENKRGQVTRTPSARRSYPSEAGHFDMLFIGSECSGGVVEVKHGEDTRFPLARVRDEQREWYRRVAEPKGLSAWLFFDIGERAREDWHVVWDEILVERRSRKAKTKRELPRLTVLMPFGKYLEVEATAEAKSIPYEFVVNEMGMYLLGWSGGLVLPDLHCFQVKYSHVIKPSIVQKETATHVERKPESDARRTA